MPIRAIAVALCLVVPAAGAFAQMSKPPSPGQGGIERPQALGAGQLSKAACCKVCRSGKACGDSCISRDKTCTKPAGCACNG